jgi:hypothetical protein
MCIIVLYISNGWYVLLAQDGVTLGSRIEVHVDVVDGPDMNPLLQETHQLAASSLDEFENHGQEALGEDKNISRYIQ